MLPASQEDVCLEAHVLSPNLRFQNWWLSIGTWASSLHESAASLQVLNKNLKALQYLNQNYLSQKTDI